MILKFTLPQIGLLYLFYSLLCAGCSNTTQWIDQNNDHSHQWKKKAELGFAFNKAYIAGDGSIYAVSQQGIVYVKPAGSADWQKENMPEVEGGFWGIDGRGNEVWIIGDRGLILYKNGNQPWVTEISNADNIALRCVYVAGNDVYAAGSNGTILRRLNENWIKEESPDTTTVIFKMGGVGGNLWAVGSSGTILHKTGDAPWYKQESPDKKARLTDLLVLQDDVWAISKNGDILHKPKNKPWAVEKLPTTDSVFTGIYGWGDDVWVCTYQGRIFHKNGNNAFTKEIDSANARNLFFTSMCGRQKEVWVAGNRGGILHRTANDIWVQEGKNAGGSFLLDVQQKGNELVAVGHCESIMTKTAEGPWKKEDLISPVPVYSGLYAQGDEIWVADKNGAIYYKNGDAEWRREPTDVKDFQLLAGYRYGNEVWLAGTHGAILYKSGSGEWLNKAPRLGNIRLEAIYGDKDNVWVVGQQGVILHKASGDARFVHEYPLSAQRHFANIKRIGNELWVVGGLNLILHKDLYASVWEEEELPEGLENISQLHYHDIYKKGNQLWVCGSSEVVLSKKDNEKWRIETSGKTEADLYRIHEDGNNLLFVGENGKRSDIVQVNGKGQWSRLDAVESELRSVPQGNDLYIFSSKGFTYKQQLRNWVHASKPNLLNVITGAALANDKIYCISENAIVSLTPDKRQYPVISSIRYQPVMNGESDSLEIEMKISSGDTRLSNFEIACDAQPYNTEDAVNEEYKFIQGSYEKPDTSGNTVTLAARFEITKNFGIVPSSSNVNKLRLRMHLVSNDTDVPFILKDKTGNLFFTIEYRPWWNNTVVRTFLLIGLVYYVFWVVFWWLYPLSFIKLYTTKFFIELAALKPPLKHLLLVFDLVIPIRKLALTSHVMNAWIHAHKENLIRSFNQNEAARVRGPYVPLPLRIKSNDAFALIDRPDVQLLQHLFKSKRSVIQIVGPGGAGKTTLAVALGHWLIQQQAGIPVLVDTDTSDLFQTILDQLTAWLPNKSIPPDLVKYMLKKQRLVIIMDALSERKAETQEHFQKIHNLVAVNALVITSRHEVRLQIKDNTILIPDALNPKSLVHFVIECLKQHTEHPVQDEQDRLAFAAKIAELVENTHHNAAISPILVRLIVDNALSDALNNKSVPAIIEGIPTHIPQVYFDYLLRMHPTQATASNFLHDYQIIEVAGLMARLSLNEKFEPGYFKASDIYELLAKDAQYNGIDAVQRFLDNEIITPRRSLGIFYLRFILDPLAEYLAASRLYDEYKKAGQLDEFIMKVAKADSPGFKMVFEQVKNYKLNNEAIHENA